VMEAQPPDHAAVRILPPLLAAIHLGAALLLGWLVPLPDAAPRWIPVLGWVISLAGLALAFGALRELVRAGTSPDPHAPTTRLVTTGIYRLSRNPIYLGFLCLTAGIPLIFGSLWGVIAGFIQQFLFDYLIIRHEEAYLARKFGGEYMAYTARVRRWL
jgi:protein-S-isoprenylcysteine O-methyltransferase Ste14